MSPLSSGTRYFCFCAGVPNLAITSTLSAPSRSCDLGLVTRELTHIACVGCRTISGLRCQDDRVTHDFRHDRVLPESAFPGWPAISAIARMVDSISRRVEAHLEISQTAPLTTCHTLEIAPAQPQIPQTQLLGLVFQRQKHRRHGRPSLGPVCGKLVVVDVLCWQHIILDISTLRLHCVPARLVVMRVSGNGPP